MSYILLRAMQKNLSRKNGRYSGITKDIDSEYGVVNKILFGTHIKKQKLLPK
jgi:hypothetical protein